MATIVIKDLPDSLELDREAMLSITGGARSRGQTPVFLRAHIHSAIIRQPLPGAALGRSTPDDRQKLYSGRKRGAAPQG